jgi:hypothetical protein
MDKNNIDAVLWDIREEERQSLPVDFLIKRILVYGGMFAIKDVLKVYGKKKVEKVFNSLKVSEMGNKRFYFFKKYLFV